MYVCMCVLTSLDIVRLPGLVYFPHFLYFRMCSSGIRFLSLSFFMCFFLCLFTYYTSISIWWEGPCRPIFDQSILSLNVSPHSFNIRTHTNTCTFQQNVVLKWKTPKIMSIELTQATSSCVWILMHIRKSNAIYSHKERKEKRTNEKGNSSYW